MLRGHLDSVTSLGYLEGWAFDEDNPMRAVDISVLKDGNVIASGTAMLFRKDLSDAGIGLGWCAFRLKLSAPAESAESGIFQLLEHTSGISLLKTSKLPFSMDGELPLASIGALVNSDPTIIQGIWQLRQCEGILMQFLRRHGVDAYIDAAYAYILGRAPDHGGHVQYARHLRQATLSPVGVLEALADTDEFRSTARQLAAPKSRAFPFV